MLTLVGAQDVESRNDYSSIISIRNLVPPGHETRLALLLGVASLAISTSAGKYFGYQQEQSSRGDARSVLPNLR
jgi:hypothetical protein